VEGYASTPDLDREDDIITEKALSGAAGDLISDEADLVFFNHKHDDHAVGKTLKSQFVPGKGIHVRVGIEDEKVWDKARKGMLKAFSIYGQLGAAKHEDREINGKKKRVRLIDEAKFYELSLVTMPANPAAKFTNIISKQLSKVEMEEMPSEDEIKALMKTATEQVKKELDEQYKSQLEAANSKLAELEKKLAEPEPRAETLEEVRKELTPAPVVETTPAPTPEPALTKADLNKEFTELFKSALAAANPMAVAAPGRTERETVPAASQGNHEIFKSVAELEEKEWEAFDNVWHDPNPMSMDIYGDKQTYVPPDMMHWGDGDKGNLNPANVGQRGRVRGGR
jgi:HK97 family phage prohead protease